MIRIKKNNLLIENGELLTNTFIKTDLKKEEGDPDEWSSVTQFNCAENEKVSLYFRKLLSFSSKNFKSYFLSLDDEWKILEIIQKQFFWYFTLF